MLGLLRHHRLVYRSRRDVGGGVTAFAFTPVKDRIMARPGQHAIFAVSTTDRKPFSLASAPEEEHVILGTSLASNSAFKRRLATLREGDQIAIRGPVYTYLKPFGIDDTIPGAVFLAQGVGITPFRSMLAHLELSGTSVTTSLVHVASRGHAFREETEGWATRSSYVEDATTFRDTVGSVVAGNRDEVFYVAGAPAFVSSAVALLREHGVARPRIRDDKYLFYNPRTNLADPRADPRADGVGP